MDWWIDFAKGPLFAITFGIMALGLIRHITVQIHSLFIQKGMRLRNVQWNLIVSDFLSWLFPFKHLIKGTILFSIVSILFHIGIILLSIFLIDHIVLWEQLLGINLPAIGRQTADILTLITMASIFVLLFCRLFIRRLRAMSQKSDYIILIMVFLPLFFGYMAGHPGVNIFSWDWAMLLHLLSAEALFVIVPFTKLAHIALYFFDRLSPVHWQFRPGAGDKVAEALFGKEAKV